MRVAMCVLCGALLSACSGPLILDWKVDLGAPSVSTPLVTESFIAVGSQLGLTIIDKAGTKRCTFESNGEVISAPKTDGERIYFGATNYIFYALDQACNVVWKFPTRDRIKSDPLVANGAVYTTSYDGHVYALDAKTGKELWSYPEPPAAELTTVEDASAHAEAAGDKGATIVQDLGGGISKVHFAEPDMHVGDFSYSSPLLEDGVLYVGNLDHHLYALTALDGTLQWRFRTDAAVTSSPRFKDGVLYFGSNDGSVYAVDVRKMQVVWRFPTQEWVNSSPSLHEDMLYIGGNDRNVYALKAQSGALVWKAPTKGPAIAIPAVFEDMLIAAGGSGDGTLYGFSRATGHELWTFRTGGKIDSDPVIVGDQLYVSSADGNLYRFTVRRNRS